ncbi:Dolichol kinase EVAN [Ananas comosus]|uniref:dolichol kinase n=1 Tax=Ananas comosus TaxID=4615 RepID=A0A199VFB6_ANACO|nr:Dolichol kinase EVAN [Ananas comosus]
MGYSHPLGFRAPPAMAGALLEHVNGERAVVLVFVSLVAFSVRLSLFLEAFALSLLTVSALLVEISAESSAAAPLLLLRRFRTRPGASSGILLGAVTLPTVMLSRLIQLSRALPRHDNGIEGEALLVSSGLVLYFGDMLARTISKMDFLLLSSKRNVHVNGPRGEIATVIQGVLLGLFLVPVFYKSILRIWLYFTTLGKQRSQEVEERSNRGIGSAIVFYASLLVMLAILVPAWMYFVQDFHMHPLLWVLNFVVTDPLKRIALCMYWVSVICVSVLRFYDISKNSKTERILLRKYYHLVAVLMFVPALLYQPAFLDLAFGAALAVFLVLEMIRVWKIWPLGNLIHQFMNAFTDHRCALPKWMSSGFNDRPLAPFAGILSLGIGDTMASMVGHKYGVLRWSKTGTLGIFAYSSYCEWLVGGMHRAAR